MAKILDDELQHGRNVVASNVKLHLDRNLAPGVRVVDAIGQTDSGNGQKLVVDVGDLAAGEERHVLIKVQADVGDVGFAAPEFVYQKAGTATDSLVAHRADAFRLLPTTDVVSFNASRNDDVRVRVLQLEASLALTTSMQAWSAGDAAAARQGIERSRADLKAAARTSSNPVLLREAQNLDSVYESVSQAPSPSSAAGMDMVKAQKARAFDLRR
jgi:hypothetical protein